MTLIYQNPTLTGTDGSDPSHVDGNPLNVPDTSVPSKPNPVTGNVVVNGVSIPESEILLETQNHPANSPGEALRLATRALVVRELLWQEAQVNGCADKPSKNADGKVETLIDSSITKLIDQVIKVPKATKKECLNYFERNKSKFTSDSIYEARHILFSTTAGDKDERERIRILAEDICKHLLKNKSDFSEFARRYSACPSGQQGGNLGQLSRGSTVPEFESALEQLEAGQITLRPVESKFGYHVISLDKKIAGKQLPFEVAREQIAIWLEASSWSKSVSQYITLLLENAEISGVEL